MQERGLGNERRRRDRSRKFVPRFAGEAFAHHGSPQDPPLLRTLTSTVAWKQSPSSVVKSQVGR